MNSGYGLPPATEATPSAREREREREREAAAGRGWWGNGVGEGGSKIMVPMIVNLGRKTAKIMIFHLFFKCF